MAILQNRSKNNDHRQIWKINPIVTSFVSRLTSIRFQLILLLVLGIVEYVIIYAIKGQVNTIQFIIFLLFDTAVFFTYVHWGFPLIARSRFALIKIGVLVLAIMTLHVLLQFVVYAFFAPDMKQFLINPQIPYIITAFHRAWQRLIFSIFLWSAYIIKESARKEQAYQNNLLYSRINPHMLFNALNMISSASIGSSHSEHLIILLSQYTRNAMIDLADDGKWPLANEIRQLDILLQINRIRFGKIFVCFHKEVPGNSSEVRVPPNIIVTIAENVFKYGVVNDASAPATISIRIAGNNLRVFIANKKNEMTGIEKNGVGITNIKQRLGHIYGKSYSFNTTEDALYYTVNMQLPV